MATLVLVPLLSALYEMMVTRVLGLPLDLTLAAVFAVGGFLAVGGILRTGGRLTLPSGATLGVWAAPWLGAAVWFGTLIASHLISGASALAWITRGDSANNLLFARLIVENNGITTGAAENPVPLPAGLLALVMASNRHGVSLAATVRSDVGAFAQVWMLLIALSCLLAGIAAASLVERQRTVIVALVGAGASLLPLSWFISGISLEYGFVNVNVLLPVVLAAWIAYSNVREHPDWVLGLLCVAGTLVLAVWSPLVVVPAALALMVVILKWKAILATRGIALVLLVAAFFQLAVYGITLTLPTFLGERGSLAAVGGIYPFPPALLGALVLLIICLAAVRGGQDIFWGTMALIAGLGAGLGVLLFSNRSQATLWGYYPQKFLWLFAVVVLILVAGFAGDLMGRATGPGPLRWIAFAALAGAFASTLSLTNFVSGYDAKNVVARVLTGDSFGQGDAATERFLKLAGEPAPTVLWHSGDDNEGQINFWLLQILSEDQPEDGFPLRYLAYTADQKDIGSLCSIIKLTGPGTVVLTAESSLAADLGAACPADAKKVVVKMD
ncbi:hypothetical protein E3T26_03335 [Cryobacterium sp. TMT1-21]|uniref:hypothetical protein n=1 Tax=Cryobacterium sp. TMT1-21 TaxID=1259234 RepID=UPI001069A958|nr:hypothetical protein [Cryobacterium sp. TMT1-21]TFD16868.1 hypothetical protein E3T26_03335 [Cryobacterium sp. TMT1-21]